MAVPDLRMQLIRRAAHYRFLADLLHALGCRGIYNVEVVQEASTADADVPSPYNMEIKVGNITRYICLRIQARDPTSKGTSNHVNIYSDFADEPNGCAIWLCFGFDSTGLEIRCLCGKPGHSINDEVPDLEKDQKRPGHLKIKKNQFPKLQSMLEVSEKLFPDG